MNPLAEPAVARVASCCSSAVFKIAVQVRSIQALVAGNPSDCVGARSPVCSILLYAPNGQRNSP